MPDLAPTGVRCRGGLFANNVDGLLARSNSLNDEEEALGVPASQSPYRQSSPLQSRHVELTLDVNEATAIDDFGEVVGDRPGDELPMRHGHNNGMGARQCVPWLELETVLMTRFRRVGHRIVNVDVDAVGFQLLNHVDHPRIPDIGTIFLEGESQHVDAGALDLRSAADHVLDGLLGDELAHAVVDAPPGQNHLRVIAEHVGLVGQVVRVDADAVSTDQARPERQEIPLAASGLQHFERVDTDPVEQDGELIHQRDVEIALGGLDDLGGFGHLDARDPEYASGDDALVKRSNFFECLRTVARYYLHDFR